MEDSLPVSSAVSVSQSHAITTEVSTASTVIVSHPSPKKGVWGSFLNVNRSPIKPAAAPPPKSPSVQAMDDILARSHSRQQQAGGQAGGQGAGNSGGISPALSARRRLSLNRDMVKKVFLEDHVL